MNVERAYLLTSDTLDRSAALRQLRRAAFLDWPDGTTFLITGGGASHPSTQAAAASARSSMILRVSAPAESCLETLFPRLVRLLGRAGKLDVTPLADEVSNAAA